jgi:hypothetical protein
LGFDLPFEQETRRSLLLALIPRGLESVECQLEGFLPQYAIVLLVDRAQLRRPLEAGEREIALARDRFHERLAFSSQALKVEGAHDGVDSLRVR